MSAKLFFVLLLQMVLYAQSASFTALSRKDSHDLAGWLWIRRHVYMVKTSSDLFLSRVFNAARTTYHLHLCPIEEERQQDCRVAVKCRDENLQTKKMPP